MSIALTHEILIATWQTLYMIITATFIATLIGLPLGIILLITRPEGLTENRIINTAIGTIVNAGRSIPFIILLIAIIPFTRFIVGTSIGTNAAIVPLTMGAIPFVARIIENALSEVSSDLVEAGQAMGASPWQIISKILIPEAFPAMIRGITLVMISLVGYAAMAGTIGGGGLGDLAIRYGYQRFDVAVMIITVVILIVIVQLVQVLGDLLAKCFVKN